jgi:microcystin degradation protein MlrC
MNSSNPGEVFIAQFCMETNTFSDMTTGFDELGPENYLRSGASQQDPLGLGCSLRALRALAEADGFGVFESICAYLSPGGPVVRAVYEELRDALLADLAGREDLRFILLNLHGAMVAEDYLDCEGDILRRVRTQVGPHLPIGVMLDPHCHLTEAMIDNADIIIAMREYPHIDFDDRAGELYRLCQAKAAAKIDPTPAIFDCRMIGLYPTMIEPMASFNRSLAAAERADGILTVSLIHGFPWGDTPETGTRVLVTADSNPELAARVARALGLELYGLRDTLLPKFPTIAKAVDQAQRLDGLIVLADVADNPGGGAPGDRTDLLQAIRATGLPSVFGTIYDPEAVAICMAAGVGARLDIAIGGKLSIHSGAPLRLHAEVKGLCAHHKQSVFGGIAPLGASAWIRSNAVDIVLASIRCQTFSPDAFTGLGIDIADKTIIGVKSMEHFRADFGPIADHILCPTSPGALSMDFGSLEYVEKRDKRYHPRVADPLA